MSIEIINLNSFTISNSIIGDEKLHLSWGGEKASVSDSKRRMHYRCLRDPRGDRQNGTGARGLRDYSLRNPRSFHKGRPGGD